ncbi:hypothetical protein PAUR_b0567 [Pseudoalteromonas aurantia 208]|uniref:Uncharacterized protein n=1 Tax=Pseudoalteromonas aurantia 208 TaxID=1314867 RepID=A0ABR9EHQ1_9GAMM|nr:hypothetical protein [Pseudoalteromonas aurantia 208]
MINVRFTSNKSAPFDSHLGHASELIDASTALKIMYVK